MFNITNAVLAAAVIAGIFTAVTGSSDSLVASPMPDKVQTAMRACTTEPWPYLNCVGTEFGDKSIRVIKIN